MARTITVTDEDSGVVTTVVLGKDDQGFSLVQEIRFNTVNGGGLEDLDLSVLRELGLTGRPPMLPQPEPAAAVTAVAEPVQEKPAGEKPRQRAVKSAGRKKPVKTTRGYRRAPGVEELQQLFAEHGGPAAVARVLNVPQHSVAGWLRRYRNEGHVFDVAA